MCVCACVTETQRQKGGSLSPNIRAEMLVMTPFLHEPRCRIKLQCAVWTRCNASTLLNSTQLEPRLLQNQLETVNRACTLSVSNTLICIHAGDAQNNRIQSSSVGQLHCFPYLLLSRQKTVPTCWSRNNFATMSLSLVLSAALGHILCLRLSQCQTLNILFATVHYFSNLTIYM